MTRQEPEVTTRRGTRVRVARSLDELEPFREAWARLQGRQFATDPDVFPLILAWQPQTLRPHVVALERGGEITALVLGRIEDIRLQTRIGYKTVYAPRVRSLTVLYGGVLGDLGDESAEVVLTALRRSLACGEVDVLRLRNVNTGSPLRRAVDATPNILHEHGAPATVHRELAVPSSYDAFLGSLSPSTLKSATRYLRRLEKRFGDRLSLRIFRGASEGDRVFTDLGIVARKTYQQALGVAFAQRQLERRIVTLLMERGWFRAYVLYLDGEPISFWQGHAYRGAFVAGVPGYDPAYTDLRVGHYVLFRLIEDLCADDAVDTLDFGWSDAEYKRRLSTRSRLEQDVHLFAPTVKGCVTNVARSSLLTTVTGVRSLLARAEMIDPIKRRWRDRVSSNGSSVVRS
jgi:CelD/BcsL family acetyltransferase involved in cellulose biosynthesis